MAHKEIRESIRQERPFSSRESETFLTLLRTTDRVSERATSPIREAGLTTAQFNVLRILRGAGDRGMHTYHVVERLVTRAPNITRLVDKLEVKGLLARRRSETDRRVVQLRITDDGLETLRRLEDPVDQAVREAMSGLSKAENTTLCDLLNRLRSPLED